MNRRIMKLFAFAVAVCMTICIMPTFSATLSAESGVVVPSNMTQLNTFFEQSADGARLEKAYNSFVKALEAPAPNDYDEHDVAACRDFLEQKTNGIKNGYILNSNYNPDDPSTYSGSALGWDAGFTFNSEGKLSIIFILFSNLRGHLDISNCTMVTEATLYYADLDSINVTGCTELRTFDISNSARITECDLSTNTALNSISVQENHGITELDLTNLTNLSMAYLAGTPLQSIDVSNCIYLDTLSVSNSCIREITLGNASNIRNIWISNSLITEFDATALDGLISFGASGGEIFKHLKIPMMSDSQNGIIELTAIGNGGIGFAQDFGGGGGGGVGSIDEKSSKDETIYLLTALPSFGAEFTGWYENGVLISTEKNITTVWGATRTLEAHFDGGVPMTSGSANDIHVLRTYLEYFCDAGNDNWVSHGFYINPAYDPNDVSTWAAVEFNENNRISKIDFDDYRLQGPLVLRDLEELEVFTMNNCNTSGFTIVGCPSLTEIYANNSNLVLPTIFNGAPNLRILELDNLASYSIDNEVLRTLDLSANTKLERVTCANGYMSEVHLNLETMDGPVSLYSTETEGHINVALENGVLTAYARQAGGKAFTGWAENDSLYSTDNPLTITESVELHATFGHEFGDDPIMGDVDGDGVLAIGDAIMILRHAMSIYELDTNVLSIADFNSDGNVNVQDALLVARAALLD